MKKKPSSKFRAATPLGLHKCSKNIMAGKQSRNKCSFRKNMIRRNTREFLCGVPAVFCQGASVTTFFLAPSVKGHKCAAPSASSSVCFAIRCIWPNHITLLAVFENVYLCLVHFWLPSARPPVVVNADLGGKNRLY